MREARIIIPDECFSQAIVGRLIAAYGGATITQGNGAWRHPDSGNIVSEPVHVVDVAGTHMYELHKVAEALISEYGQDAVYLRQFDGTVLIVDASYYHQIHGVNYRG